MPYPSVTIDINPATNDPAVYVAGVFLPVTMVIRSKDRNVYLLAVPAELVKVKCDLDSLPEADLQ